MMKNLGFHADWIILIMRCVCSVSYSVSLNGINSEWFFPSRGLRQGDPLNPYLFLICAEGFSTLIQDAKQKGWMLGAPIGRERLSINHLFFADDCILFGDASCERARVVRDAIREYDMVSWQRVNFDKSLIYSGANVASSVKEDIINLLGVRVASNPEKYLGLPMMVGRRKTWAFSNFADRFKKRVEGWSLRYLSIGGRRSLLNRSCRQHRFTLYNTFLAKIWTNNKTLKGIRWSSWEMLCKPMCTGGLGLISKTGLAYFISASLSFSQSFKGLLLPFFRYTISESWFLPFIYLETHLQRSRVDWGRDFVAGW
ncbi:reverse transcriptase [Gossypium australe]|uniref:Reverse transcriptase n=1 Tax=Gossypium australe TaxID=47621 RepID=A0A5B6WY32_9ROSI|nr:reverse transcriptase [Gossypium australe]